MLTKPLTHARISLVDQQLFSMLHLGSESGFNHNFTTTNSSSKTSSQINHQSPVLNLVTNQATDLSQVRSLEPTHSITNATLTLKSAPKILTSNSPLTTNDSPNLKPTNSNRPVTNERGMSQNVQFLLIFPMVLMVFLVGLQWAMCSWASAIALAAAQDGARIAASYQGNNKMGRQAALADLTKDILISPTVTVKRHTAEVTVTVSGQALSVFGFKLPPVVRTATAPIERLTR